MWNFPTCLGVLDSKYEVIDSRAKSGSLYCNHKTFYIVLLALDDTIYRFITVNVDPYGKNSNSRIFNNSKLGKTLYNGKLNLLDDS